MPDLPPFTAYLRAYCEAAWKTETRPLRLDSTTLPLGRAETSSRVFTVPGPAGRHPDGGGSGERPVSGASPLHPGRGGRRAIPWGVETVLERRGLCRVKVIAPELETIPERCPEPDQLFRALLTGDLLLCAPPDSGTTGSGRCAELGGAGSPRGAHLRHSGGGTAAGDRGRTVHPLQPS